MMKLTTKQQQIVITVQDNGKVGISRSDVKLHKSYMALVGKGILAVVEQGQYHTFFSIA